MTNAWIEHIKQYAKNNNIAYGCALSDPKCKETYKKTTNNKLLSDSVTNINKNNNSYNDKLRNIKQNIYDLQHQYPKKSSYANVKRSTSQIPNYIFRYNIELQKYKDLTGKDFGFDIQGNPSNKETKKYIKDATKKHNIEIKKMELENKERNKDTPLFIIPKKKLSGAIY